MTQPQAEVGIDIQYAYAGEDKASTALLKNGYVYAGVFDGHNGSHAANWCADNFPRLLEEQYDKGEPTVTALKNAFNLAHDAITDASGTTATVLVTQGNYVAVAHVGDSRAMLCHDNKAIELTEDHKLTLQSENDRLKEAQKHSRQLLILGRRVQGLMITRSIGDKSLTPEILSDPVVHEFNREEVDDYIIIASDGLWDILSSDETLKYIRSMSLKAPQEIAEQLTYYATHKSQSGTLKRDDITCCVIGFNS